MGIHGGAPRAGAAALTLVVWMLAAQAVRASGAPDPMAASSSPAALEEAKRAIPWHKLSLQDQRAAQYVVRKAAIYRRMPTRVIDCDPELFNFLVQHPEAVVNVWNLMGVSRLTVERKSADQFVAQDQAGTRGNVRVLHASYSEDCGNRVVAFVDGVYQQAPLPTPIKAKCLVLLRTGSTVESNGRTYITGRLDSFIRFERVGADLIARTLQPLVAKTADHNFTETMKFLSTYSQTAAANPGGMRRLTGELERVDPQDRQELANICDRVAERAGRVANARRAEEVRLARLQEEAPFGSTN